MSTISQSTTPQNQDEFLLQVNSVLKEFGGGYDQIHKWLAAIISVAGTVANIVTVLVMMRPEMRTPTNRLYAVMAFADLMTMLLYSIFAIGFQIALLDRTEARAICLMIYAHLSVFFHTLSVSILVAVTVFRVVILRTGPEAKRLCSMQRANVTAFSCFFISLFIQLPNVYITSWRETQVSSGQYEVYQREEDFPKIVAKVNFWSQAILVKLLPCLLLTVASIAIVRTLRDAEVRRKRLMVKKTTGSSKNDQRLRNRTIMLLGLLTVFLLTEFPQGILTLVCGIMGEDVWELIYMPLGNFLDMLTLINAGVNFVLFVSMSSEFRMALGKQMAETCSCYAKALKRREEKNKAKASKGKAGPSSSGTKANANNELIDENPQTSPLVPVKEEECYEECEEEFDDHEFDPNDHELEMTSKVPRKSNSNSTKSPLRSQSETVV